MTDPLHELRRVNLLKQLEHSKLKRSEFARRLEVSRSYLSQVLTEGFRFGEKAARSFEEKLRLKSGALDQREDSGISVIETWDKASDLPDGMFALVPRIAVDFAARLVTEEGKGSELLPPLAFRTDWLMKKNVTNRANLRTCDVRGDSMEPYLENGDIVLIDMGQTEIVNDEIFAIRYGEELRVKRLSKRFDGGLFVRSDNKSYPDEVIGAGEIGSIQVLGRMLWRGGGMN